MGGLGEAAGHEGGHGPQEHGFVAGGQVLVVADGAAVLDEPGGWVGRAARCQPVLVHFRAAARRTGLDGFPII